MGRLKIKPHIRKTCRKCGAKLVNVPEIGAFCPECKWVRKSYTNKEAENEEIVYQLSNER